jgi:hypothetical protein
LLIARVDEEAGGATEQFLAGAFLFFWGPAACFRRYQRVTSGSA